MILKRLKELFRLTYGGEITGLENLKKELKAHWNKVKKIPEDIL